MIACFQTLYCVSVLRASQLYLGAVPPLQAYWALRPGASVLLFLLASWCVTGGFPCSPFDTVGHSVGVYSRHE